MHLGYANDTIVAGNFGFAVRKQETGVVRDYVTVLAIESEGRTLGAVETEQRAFLPVCHYGSIHQVLVRPLTFPSVLEAGDVLVRRCKVEDCPCPEEKKHPAA